MEWMMAISSAAQDLPIFYYHLPGSTGVNINIYELIFLVQKNLFDNFYGVKYVSDDLWDWLNVVTTWPQYKMMWASEPKLQALPMKAVHAVLAEDFYAKTWIKTFDAFWSKNFLEAENQELWK